MQYVNLGRTGLKVSRLCLGSANMGDTSFNAWNLDEAGARPIYEAAFEAGINFFDTSNNYSLGQSERIVGKHLVQMARREEYVLATKVFSAMGPKPTERGLSRKHILDSIDASLQRLGTDYVDLLITHRFDHDTPVEESLRALDDVVRAGKARYIGASNYYAWQLAKCLYVAEMHGWTRFVTVQNHYNLIYREEEREMAPLCLDEGIAMTPWSPLARGFFAGNRDRQGSGETVRAREDAKARRMYGDDARFEIAEAVNQVARARGTGGMQVALAWMLAKPAICAPVIGASKPEQVAELAAAVEMTLTDEEMAAIEAPYRPLAMLSMDD